MLSNIRVYKCINISCIALAYAIRYCVLTVTVAAASNNAIPTKVIRRSMLYNCFTL